MADTKPITIKLAVDTATNRVAFAESGKEFVDVLLSFLTLPMGTIVRVLGKQSSVGCMDKLYGSVESFDAQFLMTEACRTMLLRPWSAAIHDCKRLPIHLDDPDVGKYYTCLYCANYNKTISFYCKVKCLCTREKNTALQWFRATPDPDVSCGVFVKLARFAIADDLVVAPAWDTSSFLDKLDVKDWSRVEERIVKIGHTEVLQLLKRSLVSKTPLTDVFMQKEAGRAIPVELKPRYSAHHPGSAVEQTKSESKKITLMLVLNKKMVVLYAKAKHDFVDLLFSFLTFPMGSIEKNLGGQSTLGCMDNLYASAEYLSSAGCIKKESEQLLLNPKLPQYFGCKSQLMRLEEAKLSYYMKQEWWCTSCRCLTTTSHAYCPCGQFISCPVYLMDPSNTKGTGEGYLRASTMYMITEELVVTPFSIMSSMHLHKGGGGKVEEIEIEMGEEEALALLKASLTSKTPLTDAFLT